MEYSISQPVARKPTYVSEKKRKQHNLGTESCVSAGDESGHEGKITVYSIKVTQIGRKFQAKLIIPLTAFFSTKVIFFSIFKRSGSYPTCGISCVEVCRPSFTIIFIKIKMYHFFHSTNYIEAQKADRILFYSKTI